MRLTYELGHGKTGEYDTINDKDMPANNIWKAINKLGQLEDIEEELGIDLITLFSQKYEQSYDLEVEKDEKTIYFCGDSYYGHWTKEQWLNFIKEVISAYRELAKLGD